MMKKLRYGDLRLPDRFWARGVVIEGGHWLWTGSKTSKGYGSFNLGRVNGKQRTGVTHRLTYELVHGPIPKRNKRGERLVLDHKCRVRSCFNPAFLKLVTNTVNVRRGQSPAAFNAKKKHCPRGHRYSKRNTYRLVLRSGRVKRYCRACKRKSR